jgi:antirestriction protein
LVKAQKAFGPALKSSTNPHFKSRYADLAACVEAVIAGLNDNGIALIQKCYDCDNGVMVETMFVHESGEMLECWHSRFPAMQNDPQALWVFDLCPTLGSLMAACGIAPEDDDGNSASRKTEIKSTVNENQILDLMAAMDEVSTLKELQEANKAAYKAANGEQAWQAKVIAKKDAKKAQLEATLSKELAK